MPLWEYLNQNIITHTHRHTEQTHKQISIELLVNNQGKSLNHIFSSIKSLLKIFSIIPLCAIFTFSLHCVSLCVCMWMSVCGRQGWYMSVFVMCMCSVHMAGSNKRYDDGKFIPSCFYFSLDVTIEWRESNYNNGTLYILHIFFIHHWYTCHCGPNIHGNWFFLRGKWIFNGFYPVLSQWFLFSSKSGVFLWNWPKSGFYVLKLTQTWFVCT